MDVTPKNELAQLILDVRYGRVDLREPETTEGLEYAAQTALALIRASQKHNPTAAIKLVGTIDGNLDISGSVDGNLDISGSVDGNLTISGSVEGMFRISGSVGSGLPVSGLGLRSVGLLVSGSVNKALFIPGSVNGDLAVVGSVKGDLAVVGSVKGDLDSQGSVGSISIAGSVDGGLYIDGLVDGSLCIEDSGSVGENLYIYGSSSVGENLYIYGSVDGGLSIYGSVGENLYIYGSVDGRVDLLKVSSLPVASLSGASFGRPVYLGDGVDLSGCDFRGFSGFEQLRFVGSSLFGSGSSKRISHTQNGEEIGDVELAVIYRQLREVYERQSNRPEAGDFYYQEMNARRRASRSGRKVSPQWVILSAYWLISGYSQRAWKAFAWFAFVAAVSTSLFLRADLLITTVEPIDGEGVEVWRPARVTEAFQFSVQSMVSFFSPPKGDLDEQGRWYQLALRFIGPTILAQAILAIREKIAR